MLYDQSHTWFSCLPSTMYDAGSRGFGTRLRSHVHCMVDVGVRQDMGRTPRAMLPQYSCITSRVSEHSSRTSISFLEYSTVIQLLKRQLHHASPQRGPLMPNVPFARGMTSSTNISLRELATLVLTPYRQWNIYLPKPTNVQSKDETHITALE